MSRAADPWYADGLRFACTRCGRCCRGEGYVWVGTERIRAIAEFLGLAVATFTRRYVRRVGARLSLVDRPGGDCVFYDDREGCTIYAARPEQCRGFPFWPAHLESPEAWAEVGRECPGVGEGRRWSLAEIRRAARDGGPRSSEAAAGRP